MLPKTNIKQCLQRSRDKRISEAALLEEVQEVLQQNQQHRDQIMETLTAAQPQGENTFDIDKIASGRLYHLSDIKKICVDYRLRFLDAHFFKGEFPEEAVSEIRKLENQHNTPLSGFKIIAPAKRLKLENADDPLLFAPMGNDYFYLIHSWGNDLHPLRKWLMWPYKSFENLVFTVFLLSIALTAITPMSAFTHTAAMQEYVLMFLFMFKAVGGIVLFYGFAKGKNFNTAIWNSNYYNA
ncbi:hypothetical protein [Altibacter sp. HG106]|uniref:hypothetical protein n=1 Tax=Altibacter sp. HG106 TaxID=3023937 RepID=UPI0023500220|nr:hypothetical protein [Altibacter sp. HG106]MDC7993881.1 hypothetical protein [Altibacter sp. HG106]